MYLLKINELIFLFILTTNAYNFKLCCPFAHQYNNSNEDCFPSREPQNLKIYNSTVESNEISGKVLNVINYAWCRNEDGLRSTKEITDPYYLQEDGELYVPNAEEEYFKSNRFCLSIKDSSDENIPIICNSEEIEPESTTVGTTLSDNDCDCLIEPPKFPEIFCENIFNGTFEYCAKCTIENTCNTEECTTNISLIEFVDVLKETTNKRVLLVNVNKKKCPYWQYTYGLNKNNTVHISILKQTCDELENSNTKASFNLEILFYVGLAFFIIVVLGLLGTTLYFIRQKRIDAARYSELLKDMNTPQTEMNPMFRPSTTLYKIPNDINFG